LASASATASVSAGTAPITPPSPIPLKPPAVVLALGELFRSWAARNRQPRPGTLSR
jgi:hypothetical protein